MANAEPVSLTWSIPWGETGLCVDCQVCFSCRNGRCPKCGGEGWLLLSRREKEKGQDSPPKTSPGPTHGAPEAQDYTREEIMEKREQVMRVLRDAANDVAAMSVREAIDRAIVIVHAHKHKADIYELLKAYRVEEMPDLKRVWLAQVRALGGADE